MKYLRLALTIAVLCICVPASAQFPTELQWLYGITGDYYPRDMVISPDGDIYTVGVISSAADLNGPAIPGGEIQVKGTHQMIVKYSASGDILWTRLLKQDGSIYIKLGPAQEVYLTGTVAGWIDLDGPSLTGQGGERYMGESRAIFIAQYTSDNTFNWVKKINAHSIYGNEFDVSPDGSLYLRGHFWDVVDFDGQLNTGQGGELYADDMGYFVAKFSSNGSFLWTKQIVPETNGSSHVTKGIRAGTNNELYILYHSRGYIDLDGPTITDQGGEWDVPSDELLLAKYAATGNLEWVTHTVSPKGNFWVEDLDVGPDGYVYVAGSVRGRIDFDGPYKTGQGGEFTAVAFSDMFIAKFTAHGDFERVITATGPDFDQAKDVSVSASAIYLTGYFQEAIDFDGPNTQAAGGEVTGQILQNLFLVSYTHDGDFLWVKTSEGGFGENIGYYLDANENDQLAFYGHVIDPASFEGAEIINTFQFISLLDKAGLTEYEEPTPPYHIDPVVFYEVEAESHVFIHPEDIVTSLVDSQGGEMPVESAIFTAVTADEELEDELLMDGCQFLGLPALLDEETNGRVYTVHMAATDRYGVTGEWQVPVHIIREGMEEAEQDETAFEAVVCSENETGQAQSKDDQLNLTRHAGLDPVSRKEPTLTAYPNPFNPQTTLSLSLPVTQHVRVAVYDMLGRQVALIHDGLLYANQSHSFTFDATKLPSGAYLVRAQGEGFVQSRRISLVK
ncbi:MAG: T9SS type A sorting domain-containing protein [Bacteroidota bacterium]